MTAADPTYVVFRDPDDGWSVAVNGVVVGDAYPTASAAVDDLLSDVQEADQDLCINCGDQAVCPECVGT